MIVILTAMKEEAEAFVEKFQLTPIPHPRLKLFGNKKIRLCIVGVGKINAAASLTDFLIDQAAPKDIQLIINSGVGGTLAPELEVGDIVLGTKVHQHDFYLPEEIERNFDLHCNPEIKLQTFKNIPNTKSGTILTGDIFIDDVKTKERLYKKGGSVCDMECYTIAKISQYFNIPCAAIKSISDKADGSASHDFEENIKTAIYNAGETIEIIIKKFKE